MSLFPPPGIIKIGNLTHSNRKKFDREDSKYQPMKSQRTSRAKGVGANDSSPVRVAWLAAPFSGDFALAICRWGQIMEN